MVPRENEGVREGCEAGELLLCFSVEDGGVIIKRNMYFRGLGWWAWNEDEKGRRIVVIHREELLLLGLHRIRLRLPLEPSSSKGSSQPASSSKNSKSTTSSPSGGGTKGAT